VRVSDSHDAIDLPVDWAFGAGEQAVTFVSRLNPDWYIEHYFSYYRAVGSLAPTPGHIGRRSNTLALAAGLQYKSSDADAGIVACFRCHSTGPPNVLLDNEIQPAELGVRCEACHGPGSLHVQAISRGEIEKGRSLIGNPKRLSAPDLNQFCGTCHRAPEGGPAIDLDKPFSVRHQPIYLSRSACFAGSKGALSCLTCHDPHRPLVHDAAHYNKQCLQCHAGVRHSTGSTQRVVQNGCVDCHMPRVRAEQYLEFTNHWIGVYSDDAKLKPRR
jgi:hypothetical protein